MVPVGVLQHLTHRRGFRTDVQGEQRGAAGRWAGPDRAVLGEERFQFRLPVRAVVEFVERIPLSARR